MAHTHDFNCENCLWYGSCDNDTLEYGRMGHLIGGQCDDYSPIDDNDEIIWYRRDLKNRAEEYEDLIKEFR